MSRYLKGVFLIFILTFICFVKNTLQSPTGSCCLPNGWTSCVDSTTWETCFVLGGLFIEGGVCTSATKCCVNTTLSSSITLMASSVIVPGMVVAGSSISPSTSTATGGLIVGTTQAQIFINQGKSLYTTLNGIQCTNTMQSSITTSTTLNSGVYCVGSDFSASAVITFNGTGLFIIKTDYNMAFSIFNYILVDGASVDRIFWMAKQSISINSGFVPGTFITPGNINAVASMLQGRLISTEGWVWVWSRGRKSVTYVL